MALTGRQTRNIWKNSDSTKLSIVDNIDAIKTIASKKIETLLEKNSILFVKITGNDFLSSFFPRTDLAIFRIFFNAENVNYIRQEEANFLDVFLDIQESLTPLKNDEKYFILNRVQAKMIAYRDSHGFMSSIYATYVLDEDKIYFKPSPLIRNYITKSSNNRKQIWIKTEPANISEHKRIEKDEDGFYTFYGISGLNVKHRNIYHMEEDELVEVLKNKQNFSSHWKLKNKVLFNIAK